MVNVIDKLLEKMNSKDAMRFSDKNIFSGHSVWLPSADPLIDLHSGTLGAPVGFTEISGKSKGGKTSIALSYMKSHQNKYPEGIRIILSSEERDNREYAERMGIDTSKVMIIKSKFVEDLFFKLQIQIDYITEIWQEEKLPGKPKIFCMWDSLGGTLCRAEAEAYRENVAIYKKALEKGTKGEIKHPQMMAFSKVTKGLVKAIISQIYDKDIVFIILNHRYANTEGSGTQSTGGLWVEHSCTLRYELVRKEFVVLDDIQVGQKSIMKTDKNDFGSREKTEIEILLGYGIVLSEPTIEYALTKGILKQEGAKKITYLGSKMSWTSKRTFYQLYKENNKFLAMLTNQISKEVHKEVLKEKGL